MRGFAIATKRRKGMSRSRRRASQSGPGSCRDPAGRRAAGSAVNRALLERSLFGRAGPVCPGVVRVRSRLGPHRAWGFIVLSPLPVLQGRDREGAFAAKTENSPHRPSSGVPEAGARQKVIKLFSGRGLMRHSAGCTVFLRTLPRPLKRSRRNGEHSIVRG